jgi:hypothetical protein
MVAPRPVREDRRMINDWLDAFFATLDAIPAWQL